MHTKLVAAAVLTGAILAAPAPAPAAASCLHRLEREATRLTFDLRLELERQHALSRDEFGSIRRALLALEAHLDKARASRCLRARRAARSRLERWAHKNVRPLLETTRERLDWICSRHTRFVIEQETHRIERALGADRIAYAGRRARALEEALRHDEVVRLCEPVAGEVKRALGVVAATKARAALPRVSEEAALAFVEADDLWSRAQSALATSGSSSRLAPEAFEEATGLRGFRAATDRCLSRAQALRRLGASDRYEIAIAGASEREPVSLARILDRCRTMRDGAPALAQVVRRHNEAHRARKLERWKYLNIKGWDMERAFAERGRPDAVERRGGRLLWHYRAACLDIRFSSRGKRLGERSNKCNDSFAAANVPSQRKVD